MTTRLSLQITVLIAALFLAFGAASMTAFADHSEEEGEESHATTVHDEEGEQDEDGLGESTTAASGDVEQLQALVTLLTQLIDLLQNKLELQAGVHVEEETEHAEGEDVEGNETDEESSDTDESGVDSNIPSNEEQEVVETEHEEGWDF